MIAWLTRHHRRIFGFLLLATMGCAVLLVRPGLRHDYRLEAFVASSDESYLRFRSFMEEFTSNEIAVIAIQTDDALSESSQAITRDIVARVSALPAVQKAQALTELPPLALNFLGDRLSKHRLIAGNLISHDGKTAAIMLQMRGEDQSPASRRQTVAALRDTVEDIRREYLGARIILAGPYVTLIDMYEYVDRDLLVFSVAAFVLIAVTLWLVFRRAGPMVFAIGTGMSATVFCLGAAIVMGFATSLITQMVVILVTVLSVATCVHLAVASEETAENLPALDPLGRAQSTLASMLAPCSAVVATTVVGFGSVCISDLSPVRSFGILMVIGLGMSLAFALTASIRLTADPRHLATGKKSKLPDMLSTLALWADRHRTLVVLIFIAAGSLSITSFGRLRFESDFVKNFRPGSEVRRSYEFIEEHLSPVGSIEVVIRRKDGQPIVTTPNIKRARELGDEIVAKHAPIRKAMSLADLATLMGDALPQTQIDLDMRLKMARTFFGPDAERNFVNAARDSLRINLRATEGIDVNEKLALADDLRSMASTKFGPDYGVEVTGLYAFYAKLVSGLLRDQYRSFALTLPAVFLVMVLAFRSFKVAAVAMVPNGLPILFCLGTMGWANIPVNMTTAMMLSVTLGIAVDDTVHYIWRYRKELQRTNDHRQALHATSRSVGRACLFTTVVIAGGFWILTLSEFLPTAYFGGLVGFTMLGTLAADLILLPVLLSVVPLSATKFQAAVG